MNCLSLNPGSSSLKFALYSVHPNAEDQNFLRGVLERLGTPEATLRLSEPGKNEVTTSVGKIGLSEAVGHAIANCKALTSVDAVGCRVVHGGSKFRDPTRVNSEVLESIRSLSPLAPLHNARDVDTIVAIMKLLPSAPIVAVFDTGFHRTLPAVASTYAIPKDLAEKNHLRRYGFHGISYSYVSQLIKTEMGTQVERVVICHLGSGASVCAVLDGQSIDTSMGMTPVEGLVMGTRSGDLDPGLILFLERELKMSYADIDRMLNHQSGLAGLSAISDDVRELENSAKSGNASAELALEVFAYRVAKYIGAYVVALQGLDVLIFCGGIGENSASMRSRVCRRLSFLGISIEESQNNQVLSSNLVRISDEDHLPVWVAKTDEERQIARETVKLLSK